MADFSDRFGVHVAAGNDLWDLFSPEQRQALEAYRQEKGRTWKSKLAQDWQTGCYKCDRQLVHHLQRIRNTWGPQLLEKL